MDCLFKLVFENKVRGFRDSLERVGGFLGGVRLYLFIVYRCLGGSVFVFIGNIFFICLFRISFWRFIVCVIVVVGLLSS